MIESFFPSFNNVVKVSREKGLEISLEDANEMKKRETNLNSYLFFASTAWIGILAVDFKRFFLKNYPIVIKLPRIKYHLISAFTLLQIYNIFDLFYGMHAIQIFSKYDKRFAALAMRT